MDSSPFSSSVGKLPDAVYVHSNKSWDRNKRHLLDISGSIYHLSEELTLNPTSDHDTADEASSPRVNGTPMHLRDKVTAGSNATINVFLPKQLDQNDVTQMTRKRLEQRYLAHRVCTSSMSQARTARTALNKINIDRVGELHLISTKQHTEIEDETDFITNDKLRFLGTTQIDSLDTKPSHLDSPDLATVGDSALPNHKRKPVKLSSKAIVSPEIASRIPEISFPNNDYRIDDISRQNQTGTSKTSPRVNSTANGVPCKTLTCTLRDSSRKDTIIDADTRPSSRESIPSLQGTRSQTVSLHSVFLVIRLQRRFRENRRRALKRIQETIRLERKRSDNFCEKKIEKKASQYENLVRLIQAVIRVQRWYREYRRQRKLRIIEQFKLSKSRSVANLNQKLDIDAQSRQLSIASAVLMVTRIQKKFRKRRAERKNRIKQLHRRDSDLQLKHLRKKLLSQIVGNSK